MHVPAGAADAAVSPPAHTVTAWATALQAVPDPARVAALYRAPAVAGRTVRQIVVPRVDGHGVSISLSNRDGRAPLVIGAATVALAGRGAALRPGTVKALVFGGRPQVTLAPGERIDTDFTDFDVKAGEPLAISLYVSQAEVPRAWHRVANQTYYLSLPGDHAGDTAATAFHGRFTHGLWMTRVLTHAAPHAYAVAAIGDSITDGLRSTLDANRRWTDTLARRLRAAGIDRVSVLNLGIAGNRLLNDSPCYGRKLVGRFDNDALNAPGVRAVVVLIGINDINFSAVHPSPGLDCGDPRVKVDADALIAGYRQLIADAHRRHVRIYGGTLTPASLPPAREAIRQRVNQWIRAAGALDGVVDFDAALRDPARADRLRPAFDSGDHIHPNDAGYAAMGAAVPLAWFAAAP